MAVAGLVLGILAVAFCWLPGVNIVTTILAIVGIVLSVMGTKQLNAAGKPTGVATAGLVLSIIGLVIGAIGVICTVVLAAATADYWWLFGLFN